MEQDLKITIINAQKIAKKETGELMTKVDYMTWLEQTDKFYGYSVLTAWVDESAFEKCKQFLAKEVIAKIGVRKGKYGSLSAYIKKINNIEL